MCIQTRVEAAMLDLHRQSRHLQGQGFACLTQSREGGEKSSGQFKGNSHSDRTWPLSWSGKKESPWRGLSVMFVMVVLLLRSRNYCHGNTKRRQPHSLRG